MKDFPEALLRQLLLILLIGLVLFVSGTCITIFTHDWVMFGLSVAVLIASTIKGILFYRTVRQGSYEVINGKCLKTSMSTILQTRKVIIETDDENPVTIYIPKNCKPKAGKHYRFYFSKTSLTDNSGGNPFKFGTAAAFLGYDEMPNLDCFLQ